MPNRSDRPVYLRIKRKIVLGQIPAGQAINMKDLEEEVSSSQVPIREALIKLAAEDLVDAIPGRGFFVKPHDLTEIVGNFDILSFLLIDAADYIVSTSSRREHLASMMDADFADFADSPFELDLFEATRSFSEIVSHHYRRPHSDILTRALYRSSHILHIDSTLNGDDLFRGAREYLLLTRRGEIALIEREVPKFWEERKARLAETLAFAANMDLAF